LLRRVSPNPAPAPHSWAWHSARRPALPAGKEINLGVKAAAGHRNIKFAGS
jgi:hypothetical protein